MKQLEYAIIEKGNGFALKPLAKADAAGDSIEFELYADTMEEIKAQYKAHVKSLG
jgi:hypothetical protein